MYLIQLDVAGRDYLLSLLKGKRGSVATQLAAQLRAADDTFGVVMWTDDDIASQLKQQNIPTTSENVRAVRESYYGRHIDDRMVERDWEVLEAAASELKHGSDG